MTKKPKHTNEINLENTFYLTQYIQNITVATQAQYKKLLMRWLLHSFFPLSLQNLACILIRTAHLNADAKSSGLKQNVFLPKQEDYI